MEIAQALGWTHPAIHQMATDMLATGILVARQDATDKRRRLLALSTQGQQLLRQIQPVWESLRGGVDHWLIQADATDLLPMLERLEKTLMLKITLPQAKQAANMPKTSIEIVDYRPAFAPVFERLNRAWIEACFRLEEYDRKMFSDPEGVILAPGGRIFMALRNGEPLGTCALACLAPGHYELIKMAVDEAAQGQGLGRLLLRHAIAEAARMGGQRLSLTTNSRLTRAIALYERHGFERVAPQPEQIGQWERVDVWMERRLTAQDALIEPA
jgi:GNAT superfamily N-acetyltransferase/DNA-binding MarR family transcriptional regulator